MSILNKILLLEKEIKSDILNKSIINPETGRKIKIKTALGYEDDKVVKQKADALIKKNKRSLKPKANKLGVNKELVELLKNKGYQVTIPPPIYVKEEDLQFNPNYNKKTLDKEWAYKFKCLAPSGKEIIKTAYTEEFKKRSAEIKFNRISKIKEKDITEANKKLNNLLKNDNVKIKECAMVLSIIIKTGQRVGSVNETESGNLGVRTLKKENILIEGDTIKLSFIGKSFQKNYSEIKDKNLANALKKQIANKNDTDEIFPNASYNNTTSLFKSTLGNKFKIKDLRTYKACEKAIEKLNDKSILPPPLSKDPKEATKQIKEKINKTFEYVSNILNNSPNESKNSYIHPAIIDNWITNLGLEIKSVNNKTLLKKVKESLMLEQDDFNNENKISMDKFFEKYSDKITDLDYDNEEQEEEDLCDEYPAPDWLFNDDIIFLKK